MPLHNRISVCENLSTGFKSAVDIFSGNTAQVFRSSTGEFTGSRSYAEMYSIISSLASSLIESGFPFEGRAGINSETRPEWNIADVAILACGGATVGLYTSDNTDNLEHKILDSELSLVFTDNEKRLRRILELPESIIPNLKHIVSFDPVPPDISDPRLLLYSDLLENGPDEEAVNERISQITPRTTARIIYTSGTVGKAKGAVLSHKNLLSNLKETSKTLEFSLDDISLSHLPTAHILQTMIANMTLFSGGTLAYSVKNNLRRDLKDIRPTIFPGVPRVFSILLDIAEDHIKKISDGSRIDNIDSTTATEILEALGLDRLRLCLSGAAKLDRSVADVFRTRLGINILEGYGMSETSPVISINTPDENKPGTVGKVISGVDVKIMDDEGRERPPGIQGEIAVKGDNVFSGYLNLPVINASVLSRDDYFFTGDIGLLDHDGFLQVIGRKGSQVKFANGNYYDLEKIAEDFLDNTLLIQQAVAVGEQKDYPVAMVSLADNLEIVVRYADSLGIPYDDPYDLVYSESIIDAVRNEFHEIKNKTNDHHSTELIHKVIYIRPFSTANGEATATGKVRLKKIISKYVDEIEKLYADESDFRVLEVSRRNI